ncbi:MAG: hypothetical protein WC126_08925 [Proteiniphilum sp.]
MPISLEHLQEGLDNLLQKEEPSDRRAALYSFEPLMRLGRV